MHPLVKKIALYFLSNRFSLKIKINLINNRKNTVTILNLHSVTDNISKCNKLTPKLFEDLVIFVKKNFTLVAFSNLKREIISDKPLMILSFGNGSRPSPSLLR